MNNIQSGVIGSGVDNGYNGEYSAFTLLSSVNAGTAIVQGWEINYSQQLVFLPGLLKGLTLSGNYTILDTHGDFGGSTTLSSGDVANFIPRSGNASVSWRYRNFSTRVLVNHVGAFLTTYAAGNPSRNIYVDRRTLINWGCSYRLNRYVDLTLDLDNLTNARQGQYMGTRDRVQSWNIPGASVTVGVSGTF